MKNPFIEQYKIEPEILNFKLGRPDNRSQVGTCKTLDDEINPTGASAIDFMFPFGFFVTRMEDEDGDDFSNAVINHQLTGDCCYYLICLNSNEQFPDGTEKDPTRLYKSNPYLFHYHYICEYEETYALHINGGYILFKSPRVLCIKTYYPFHEFYFSI